MNGGDTHVQLALLIARDTEGAYKTLDHSERYRMTALPTLSGGFEEASMADKGHDRAARVRDSMSLNGQEQLHEKSAESGRSIVRSDPRGSLSHRSLPMRSGGQGRSNRLLLPLD